MSDNASESYEIETNDGELHAISVMLQALDRHVTLDGKDRTISEVDAARKRCAAYVLERIGYER